MSLTLLKINYFKSNKVELIKNFIDKYKHVSIKQSEN